MSFLQNFTRVTTNKLTFIAKPEGKSTSSSEVACVVGSRMNWLLNLFFPQKSLFVI
jgi:hypothetical protein